LSNSNLFVTISVYFADFGRRNVGEGGNVGKNGAWLAIEDEV
jgi:hypothetical protein